VSEFNNLSKDEMELLTNFRNGDRLHKARMVLASCQPASEPEEDERQRLEFIANYMECSEYGRARLVEAAEAFATAPSVEEAMARIAAADAVRPTATVIDIKAPHALYPMEPIEPSKATDD
jgi:hypothetical protein